MRPRMTAVCLVTVALWWPSWAVSAPVEEGDELQSLWRLQEEVARDIESLRLFMGVQKSRKLLLSASRVQPPDTFAQALEFHRKAGRFRFEHLRELVSDWPRPEGMPSYADSAAVLESSLLMIREVMDFYGLQSSDPVETGLDADIRPRDVFDSIRATGRQLNLLLDEQLSPSDTYMTLIRAIGYASELLSRTPGTERIPEEPTYTTAKTPEDVWNRMLECLNLIEAVYGQRGLESLHISIRADGAADILPVDVNDLANLLVTRLAFLTTLVPGADEPMEPVYPGRKFPIHVYGKASVLRLQLAQLAQMTAGAGE